MKFNDEKILGKFENGIATYAEQEDYYHFYYPIEQFNLKDEYYDDYSGDVWTVQLDESNKIFICLLFIDKDGLCFRNGDETVEDIAEILYDEFIEECCEEEQE